MDNALQRFYRIYNSLTINFFLEFQEITGVSKSEKKSFKILSIIEKSSEFPLLRRTEKGKEWNKEEGWYRFDWRIDSRTIQIRMIRLYDVRLSSRR